MVTKLLPHYQHFFSAKISYQKTIEEIIVTNNFHDYYIIMITSNYKHGYNLLHCSINIMSDIPYIHIKATGPCPRQHHHSIHLSLFV